MYETFCKLMDKRNFTHYKISKDTGVDQATLSRWKNGKAEPSLETLQVLADYFEVSLDYLQGREKPTYQKASSAKPDEANIDLDIRRIERARANMPSEDKEKMMTVLAAVFDEYFADDYVDDDFD